VRDAHGQLELGALGDVDERAAREQSRRESVELRAGAVALSGEREEPRADERLVGARGVAHVADDEPRAREHRVDRRTQQRAVAAERVRRRVLVRAVVEVAGQVAERGVGSLHGAALGHEARGIGVTPEVLDARGQGERLPARPRVAAQGGEPRGVARGEALEGLGEGRAHF
jgi:hypothetical protein